MGAIENLLERLDSLDKAVAALSLPSTVDSAINDHLARGVAVNGLVLIETFLKERMQEWSSVIMLARVPAQALPGGTTQYENRLMEVLPRRLRDSEYADSVQRSTLLQEIGRSLTSLYTTALVPHPFAFMWAGANVQEADIEAIVSLVAKDRNESVWGALTSIWSSVDRFFPGNTSLRTVFGQVCALRHAAAHEGSPSLPTLNLRSTSRNVKLVCLCVDTAVSMGLRELGVPQNTKPKRRSGQVTVRTIEKMGNRWREFGPGKKSATKRHLSLEQALQEAIPRARVAGELVLVIDERGNILDWRVPIG